MWTFVYMFLNLSELFMFYFVWRQELMYPRLAPTCDLDLELLVFLSAIEAHETEHSWFVCTRDPPQDSGALG